MAAVIVSGQPLHCVTTSFIRRDMRRKWLGCRFPRKQQAYREFDRKVVVWSSKAEFRFYASQTWTRTDGVLVSNHAESTFEGLLSALVRTGLAHADAGLLRDVAEALWYEGKIPELSLVPEELRATAGYVADRLVRFNVVPKAQKSLVLLALAPFKPEAASCCLHHRDPLAVQWAAREDLTERLPELMPYQTRQYALDRRRSDD